ncbi:hypothetical protein ATK74_0137 [Propionicimonas paludicola]|uniref:DUF4203 domain-containing protein n=1 Tax=Propionicimonas paludicola TaxID=185243 RepID=A0A2A9CMD3_9ACTN|nr:hypothetical protein [Propionicimonas paludicola]PFG15617.1 hypothetical protein ATK74_0137 [Propionicimonas paludicola]
MGPVVQAWVEIGLGLIFCYVGYTAARVVIGLWGAVIGLALGGAADAWLSERISYLATQPWLHAVIIIVIAVAVAWLAFGFYWIGVLAALGSIGWGLGTVLSSSLHLADATAFGVTALVAGLAVVAGWVLDLPRTLLILITALIGAAAVVSAAAGLFGSRISWFDPHAWALEPWFQAAWLGGFLVLAISGVVAQQHGKSERTLRAAYRRR